MRNERRDRRVVGDREGLARPLHAADGGALPGLVVAAHVGYSTPEHRAAIEKLGVSPLHRMSFQSMAYQQWRLKQYYEQRAAEYDEWYEARRVRLPRPARVAGGPRGARGRRGRVAGGAHARRRLRHGLPVPGHLRGSVTGLDQSPSMIEIASARVPGGRFVVSDALPLPFADGEFDRVFTGHFYGHLVEEERVRFLAEARRVADELVVVDTALQPDHEPIEWQERVLNYGLDTRSASATSPVTGWRRSWAGQRSPRRAVVRGGPRLETAHVDRQPAGELVAVDALGREDAGRCRARRRAARAGCAAADLAVAAALGLLDRALEALLGGRAPARLGAAAVGGQVDAAGIDPDVGEGALEVADQRLAELLRLEPDVVERVGGLAVARRDRDQQVLGLDAAGPEARGHARRLERGVQRASRTNLSNISQSPRVLLVNGLPRDAERLGDLGPRPPVPEGALDLAVLHAVGEAAERDDGGEAVGGALGVGELGGAAAWAVTQVDSLGGCQPRLRR